MLIFKDDCDFWDFLFIIIIRLISYRRAKARGRLTTVTLCELTQRTLKTVCIIFCVIRLIEMFVLLGFTIITMKRLNKTLTTDVIYDCEAS